MRKKRIPIKRFRKIVGKLRCAALCVPAGKAQVTTFNRALKGDPKVIICRANSDIHKSFGYWLMLIEDSKTCKHIRCDPRVAVATTKSSSKARKKCAML